MRNANVTRPNAPRRPSSTLALALAALLAGPTDPALAGEDPAAARYREAIEPILAEHCYACHGNGIKKGSVTLDAFADDRALLARPELWNDVLKNVRAGLMPPAGKPRPSAEELRALESWIKRDAFALDPSEPDPGRVTLRRLNRAEYRNTVRDLVGIDYRTDEEFPADDTGYGFDNIGDVLSVSPLLLEKYMQAAESIVAAAVPTVSRMVETRNYVAADFRDEASGATADRMSVYKDARAEREVILDKAGPHRLVVDLNVRGHFDFDPGRARVAFSLDGRELFAEEVGWEDGKKIHREFAETLAAGVHTLAVALKPLVPPDQKKTYIDVRLASVRLEGPLAEADWVRPKNFERFFDRDDPKAPEARRAYAREILARFATRAFRRPADARTVDRLLAIAEDTHGRPGATVEQGVGRAIVAVLASPRFLFLVENAAPEGAGRISVPIDEFALASRLSYFLWSTMPDDELTALATRGALRRELPAQVKRMLADPRSEELVRNFTGQWLQVRDFEHFPIQHKVILRRDGLPGKMDGEMSELRKSMKQETEAYFAHVVRDDRPVLELLDSDYAFVNDALAKLYEIPGVSGREIRKVTLPTGSPRGGLLTQAGILMITSNPSRTSPVKRGQFVLENILGTPTPPPPPDIPSLEDTIKNLAGREPTMREVMEVHRKDPLCASCHNRMDPLGLAFENFNALGTFRAAERKVPIDASGTLLTGRKFQDAVELKKILVSEYRADFYRCLAEKLTTYALGRGIEYHDVETLDRLVGRLEANDGRFSALLMGIVESAPFQKRRVQPTLAAANPPTPSPAATGPDHGAKP